MNITIDTTQALSAKDAEILRLLLGDASAVERSGGTAAAPAKKAAAAKPKPTPAPEPEVADEEPEVSGEPEQTGPTMQDAVAKATELVAKGKSGEIKGVLNSLGVAKVSELPDAKLGDFLDALEMLG